MLTAYLVCLAAGGVFLAASLLGGHHHAGDHDAGGGVDGDDAGADGGAGHDHDAHAPHDAHDAHGAHADTGATWIPFLSFRFWTFALTFFGLTGTALTLLGTGPGASAAAAAALGLGTGTGAAWALRRLSGAQVDSSAGPADWVGQSGRVLLPLAGERPGKVRLQVKGQAVDLLALPEESGARIEVGAEVLVISVEGGVARVVRADNLLAGAPAPARLPEREP